MDASATGAGVYVYTEVPWCGVRTYIYYKTAQVVVVLVVVLVVVVVLAALGLSRRRGQGTNSDAEYLINFEGQWILWISENHLPRR
jgi:hypothetical protein